MKISKEEKEIEKALEAIIEIVEANENCLQEMYNNMIEFNKKVTELLIKSE